MAKLPKKDINLYPLVVAPKKNTMKKGALFGILGTVAVLLLGSSYAGARIYVHTQENLVSEMEAKANDTTLMEKINNANAVANDISTLRTAGDVYTEVRTTIDGTQEICDNFSEDLVQKLVGCEKTVSPSRGEIQVAEITGLSYDGSTLSIAASSTNSQYVSTFVTNLTRLDLFSSITYDGYSLSDSVYTYTVNAVFKPAETTATDADGNPVETTTEVIQ